MIRPNLSVGLKALIHAAFFLFMLYIVFQTTPLWTRLVLGGLSVWQHVLLVLLCILSCGILAACRLNRVTLLAIGLLLPVGLTFVSYFHAINAERLQVLANCTDLLRLPAAVLFGAIYCLVELSGPKLLLIIYLVSICVMNAFISYVESSNNSYYFDVPPGLTTTIDESLGKEVGMEGEIRPRAACLTPNGLASVLSLGFLAVITTTTYQPKPRARNFLLVMVAFGIAAGLYWSTVRAALGPAFLLLFLLLVARAQVPAINFRRASYLMGLAFALLVTIGSSSFSSEIETRLRPYIGKLAASSSSLEREENWKNIQQDIFNNPEIALVGIDLSTTRIGARKHQSGICDNLYYYFVYHWGVIGLLFIGVIAVFPFTKLFNDETYGVALWACSIFIVLASAFTDEIYYLPAAFLAFLIGLSSTRQALDSDDGDEMSLNQILH